jgi:hypothetical protein
VITNAATGNGNVIGLVYVAAFAPDEGEILGELTGRFPGSTLGPAQSPPVALPDGGVEVSIPQDRFWEQFAADLPEADAKLAATTQRPISLAAFTDVSGPPAWKAIPSRFITFRFVNADGVSRWARYHWEPEAGMAGQPLEALAKQPHDYLYEEIEGRLRAGNPGTPSFSPTQRRTRTPSRPSECWRRCASMPRSDSPPRVLDRRRQRCDHLVANYSGTLRSTLWRHVPRTHIGATCREAAWTGSSWVSLRRRKSSSESGLSRPARTTEWSSFGAGCAKSLARSYRTNTPRFYALTTA